MKAVLALALAVAGLAAAQSSSSIAINNGVEVSISANLGNPTGQQSLRVEFTKSSGNSFYRIFRDQNGLAVFAYELVVNRNEEGTEFALTAKPVETEFAARFPQADGGKPVPTLSSDQDFNSLKSGAEAQISLFELAGLGLRVTDTVEVKVIENQKPEDVPLTATQGRLRFTGLVVSANRMELAADEAGGSVSGRYLMFYIAGRGAFYFATSQPDKPGFLKAGSIQDDRLEFTWNNEIYDCVSAKPILDGVRTGEVWVYNDPGYVPKGNWTSPLKSDTDSAGASEGQGFFAAASDSLNWWLP